MSFDRKREDRSLNSEAGFWRRGIPVALAFVLSILPFLVLSREFGARAARDNDEIRRAWVQETTSLAHRFEAMCQPKFWVREASRSLHAVLERVPGRDRAAVIRALTTDVRSHLPRGMIAPRVYAWYHGNGQPGASGEFLTGPGFQTGYKYLFSRLLQRLGQTGSSTADLSAADGELLRQISGILGGNLPAGVFQPECRGMGFPVFCDRAFRFAAWDTVAKDGKPLVTYMLLFPNGKSASTDAIRLALREFRRFVPDARHVPAVLPIRTPVSGKRWRLETEPIRPPRQVISICRIIRQEMSQKPPRGAETLPQSVVKKSEGGFPWQGYETRGMGIWNVRLPGHRLIEPVTSDGWWGLLAPLHPLTGSVAVLATPIPEKVQPPPRVWMAFCLILLGWGLWAAYAAMGPRPVFISIRMMLGLWVIGLVLVPVCSIWGSSSRMFDAFRENRQYFLETELRGTLEDLENRFVMKRNEWLTACRALLVDPALTREFDPARVEDPGNLNALATLRNSLSGKGIRPHLIIVAASEKESLSWFDPSLPQATKAGFGGTFKVVVEELCLSRRSRRDAAGQVSAGLRAVMPNQTRPISDNEFFNRTDTVYESQIGAKRNLSYYNFFRMKNGEEGVVLILWSEESQYAGFLAEEFRKHATSGTTDSMAAFQIDPEPALVCSSGDPVVLGRISAQVHANRFGLNSRDGLQLRASLFSSKLPGYFFVASRSIEPILSEIASERLRMFKTLFLLLLVTAFCTMLLGTRVSDPIRAMTRGLQRISDGDLLVKLPEARRDETGVAGRNLNQMVLWLKERLNISRFVSGDVMELVAGGNHENLSRAVTREAVVLVSDVRSFTTLSESHPPEQMFLMINRHLQGMTRIIRTHRGTIDRFIGDAIQVVFYADGRTDPAQSAVLAALAMMREHDRIVRDRQAAGLFPYAVGIGIERGTFVTGVLGDPAVRLDFTVLGDAIREAAELEARSKQASHTRIVCSKQVRDELNDRFGFVPVPGDTPDSAWELLGPLNTIPEPVSEERLPVIVNPAVPGTVDDHPAFDWKAPLSIVAGLALMLVLALGAIESIDTSVRETLGRQMRSEIRKEFGVLERLNDPKLQIFQLIERRVDAAVATWTPDVMGQVLPAVFADIPSFSWAVAAIPMTAGPFRTLREARRMTSLVCGGARFPIPEDLTKNLYWRLVQDFQPRLLAGGVAGINSAALDSAQDGHAYFGFKIAEDIAYRSPAPVRIDGRDYLFFWVSNLSLTSNPDPFVAFMGLMPVEACTFELGHRAFVENQSRDGRSLAMIPVGSGETVGFTSGVFQTRPAFKAFLGKDQSSREELESDGERWLVLGGDLLREKTYRLSLARRIASDTFRKADWVAGVLIAFIASLGLLLVVVVSNLASGSTMRLGLRTQMVGALLLLVMPLVMQGVAFLERAGIEEDVLRRNRSSEEAAEVIRAIERSQTVYAGYRCSLIESVLNHPSVLRTLMRFEPHAEKETRRHLTALLSRIQGYLLERGGCVIDSSIGGPSFVAVHSHDKEPGSSTLLKARVLHAPYSRILKQFSQESRKSDSSRDLLISFGADSIRDMASLMASPITLAEIALGRKTHYSLMFAGQVEATVDFQLYLFHHRIPRYFFVGHLTYEGSKHLPLDNWQEWLRSKRKEVSLFCARRRIPILAMSDPYCLFYRSGYGFRYRDLFSYLYPPVGQLVSDSFTTGSLLSEVVQFQGKELRTTVAPEISGDPSCFLLVANEGAAAAALRAETVFNRWLMAGLLVFCVLSARQISSAFLRPIIALTRAAHAVREGDLTVRLSEDEPGEFRLLAASFNRMADGVQEGSLLSRFVSESVRDVARSNAHVDGADRGEAQRLTVLFAGLATFKTMLSEMPPDRLFSDLNRYLEAMSGMIRNNGGEIDKFIGDKILAVFRDDPATSRTAMENAVAAAIAMKGRYREIESEMHSSLGIGIVTGPVIAGILGTAEIRLEYTVLGDTVNLASRLGDLAQKLDKTGGIFIESETRNALEKQIAAGEFTVRALDLPPIKGKTRSISAFSVESR